MKRKQRYELANHSAVAGCRSTLSPEILMASGKCSVLSFSLHAEYHSAQPKFIALHILCSAIHLLQPKDGSVSPKAYIRLPLFDFSCATVKALGVQVGFSFTEMENTNNWKTN